MNPIQIVKAHCDCYQADGRCLGITLNDKLDLVRFRKEGLPCLLAEPIQRCHHFEQCILPMEKRQEWANDSRKSASMRQDFQEGAHEYRIRTGFMPESIRLCPQCRKSKIGKGRKLCDLCTAQNRRDRKAKSDHKRNAESNSPVSSISGIDTQ
jgi:hypothetical protein